MNLEIYVQVISLLPIINVLIKNVFSIMGNNKNRERWGLNESSIENIVYTKGFKNSIDSICDYFSVKDIALDSKCAYMHKFTC